MPQRFTARAAALGDRDGTVVPDAVVDVDQGEIRWVGPAADAPPPGDGVRVDLPGVLIPGLVNAHSHAPMVLLRGQGEALPLDRLLREAMWPREARLTGDDVEVEIGLGPQAAYTLTVAQLRAVAEAARERGFLLHLQFAETAAEGTRLL